jgi:hypothetical protein
VLDLVEYCDLLENFPGIWFCNISEKGTVTNLGGKITTNLKVVNDLNLYPVTEYIKNKTSLQRRLLFSKVEALSHASHLFSSIDITKSTCCTLDRLLYHFLWKNKPQNNERHVMTNTICVGGLKTS